MMCLRVQIVEWVDNHVPGFVRCELHDADGRVWSFVEKAPVVSIADIHANSQYPQPGVIACEILRRWHDENGRELATVDTERPWEVEAADGSTRFDVLQQELTEED